MATGPVIDFIDRLRRGGPPGPAAESDGELLRRFVHGREEEAFADLMRRHGPMVWAVCRRLVPDPHEAEDAFQATFLVLVKKARGIGRPNRLANWLYGVAYRVAVRTRAYAARRRFTERGGVEMYPAPSPAAVPDVDVAPVLYEELSRLPEKYRTAVVLCYLNGRSSAEAARELAWPVGTVKGRLSRARDMLRRRLLRRGVSLTGAGLATLLLPAGADAGVPAHVIGSTLRAAADVAAGNPAVGVVSAHAAALTRGVVHAMALTRFTVACVVATTLGLAGSGVGLLSLHALGNPGSAGQPAAAGAAGAAVPDDQKGGAAPNDQAVRDNSRNNLKQIMIALHQYHNVHQSFPPAAVYDKAGKSLLSWRVLILPYLEEDHLFKQFRLDEPWDSEHNKALLDPMPRPFSASRERKGHLTHYQVFHGPGALFEGTGGIRVSDVLDGTSNTVAVVEAADAVPWTKPTDLPFAPNKPLPKLGGLFPDVFHVAVADGSVLTIPAKFNEKVFRAMITRSGGETIKFDDLRSR